MDGYYTADLSSLYGYATNDYDYDNLASSMFNNSSSCPNGNCSLSRRQSACANGQCSLSRRSSCANGQCNLSPYSFY